MRAKESKFMERVVGQGHLKGLFQRLIERDRLPHALLFYGPSGGGKEAAGIELGRFLLCREQWSPCGECASCRRFERFEHPDFHYLFPIQKPKGSYTESNWEHGMDETQVEEYRKQLREKSDDIYYPVNFKGASAILIDQVRQLIQKSSLTSFQGGNRFALISPADLMNVQAQNSLLKLLEEPAPGFYLCLVSSRPESLLATVKSRCQPYYFPPLPREEIITGLATGYGAKASEAESAADRSEGSFVKALTILREGDPLRDFAVKEFILEVVKKNPVSIHRIVQDIGKRDRNEAKKILLSIDFWFRDIQMMDSGLEPQYNRDMQERLEKFRKNIEYSDIAEMRGLLSEAIDLIDKNVYIDMIFINLANRLSRRLKWNR